MVKPPWQPPQRPPAKRTFSESEFRQGMSTGGRFAESDYVEFKSGTGTKPIQETVVAFSNSEGGMIIVGVDDDGRIVGRSVGKRLSVVESLHESVQAVRDPGRYIVRELDVEGLPVTLLSVDRRVEGFAQMADGRVLVRRGARNVPLLGSDLARLVAGRLHQRFEATDTGVPLDKCDPLALQALRSAYRWRGDDLPPRLEEAGMLMTGADTLTVAGALYLLPAPHSVVPKAFIEVFRYRSDEGDYDRRVQVDGPLNVQVERAATLIGEELGAEMVVDHLQRYELPRLPPVVVREALANAVAHRAYEVPGTPIRVELRPDRVVIKSPGGLIEPVTVENIRDQQAARNIDVIHVLRRFGLAEDAGRGVDVMEDSMQLEMLDPPRFADDGTSVQLTLPIHTTVSPRERAWVRRLQERGQVQPRDYLLLVHAARGAELTNRLAREFLGVDSVAARQALQRLRDAGYLEQLGQRGGATYRIGREAMPPLGLHLPLEELQELVVRLAEEGPVTNASVRAATGVDRDQALAVLGSLVADGRLERRGSRRATYYISP